ncbi:MAG: hypothetical protein GXY91_00245 [Clostridia bacterium]|nr:hypothetical protein [Clostridia bacterium]
MKTYGVEIQSFQVPKKCKCNLCDRLEKIDKRLVLWHENQVVGDLLLCNPCLEVFEKIVRGEEQVIQEWNFQGGVV